MREKETWRNGRKDSPIQEEGEEESIEVEHQPCAFHVYMADQDSVDEGSLPLTRGGSKPSLVAIKLAQQINAMRVVDIKELGKPPLVVATEDKRKINLQDCQVRIVLAMVVIVVAALAISLWVSLTNRGTGEGPTTPTPTMTLI
jgi:hypothetical protein